MFDSDKLSEEELEKKYFVNADKEYITEVIRLSEQQFREGKYKVIVSKEDIDQLFEEENMPERLFHTGVAEKRPRAALRAYYYRDFDEYTELLSEQLENSMFYTYFDAHFCHPHGGGLREREPPVKQVLTGERLAGMFPAYEKVPEMAGYTYESYAAAPFPQLEEREATYAMVFTDGPRVVCSVDNTYKYQEWDELFDHMIGKDGELCSRRGLHRAFVIYTDSSDTLPVWTLYEKTVAGFAVDRERRTLTAFGPESAVLIFHALYQLCSAQYCRWFGVTSRSSIPHTFDDSPAASGEDPYVAEFRRRLDRYQYDYDEPALLRQLDEP